MKIKNKEISNETIAWVAVVAGVVIGVAFLIVTPSEEWGVPQQPVTATTTAATATTTETSAPAAATTKNTTTKGAGPTVPARLVGYNSVSYLLSLDRPLLCTIEYSASYAKRSGTIYVADGKMRGNFSGYADGTLKKTMMIDDGASLYAWAADATTGLKLPAPASASGSAIATHGGIDLVTPFNFACAPWIVDESVFTPPASVTFSNTY